MCTERCVACFIIIPAQGRRGATIRTVNVFTITSAIRNEGCQPGLSGLPASSSLHNYAIVQ